MKLKAKAIFSLCMLSLLTTPIVAENLFQVYQHALSNDPQLKASEAGFLAIQEQKPQALSALKPQVTLSGSTGYTLSHQERTQTDGSSDVYDAGYKFEVKKSLFDKEKKAQVGKANASVAQALANVRNQRQELIIRVADAYFQFLKAQDTLEFRRTEKEAIRRQMIQVNAQFEAGRMAITDVKESQARFDLAVSLEVVAKQQLDLSRENINVITGRYYKKLSAAPLNVRLAPPRPNNIDAWVKQAVVNSKDVEASKHAVNIAQHEVNKQRAARSPKVDLFARHGGNINRIDLKQDKLDAAVGIQFNMPLYTGGLITSRIKQARHSLHQSQQQLESQKRLVTQQVRSSYLSLVSGLSQIKALKQALNSTQTAAKATQAGFEVGTRTAVDVLLSLRESFSAKLDYSIARYEYLLNKLKLRKAVGTLSVKDIQEINRQLIR